MFGLGRRPSLGEPVQWPVQLPVKYAGPRMRYGVAHPAGGRPRLSTGQPPAPFRRPHPRPMVRVRAKAQHLAKWQEKRWERRDGLLPGGIRATQYLGFYQTSGGRNLSGLVIVTDNAIEPFILNPPLEDIRVHTGHGRCFLPRGEGLYFVHLGGPPQSVDEAIVNVEELLNECAAKAGWPRNVVQHMVTGVAHSGA
jgi:hypothetical protein